MHFNPPGDTLGRGPAAPKPWRMFRGRFSQSVGVVVGDGFGHVERRSFTALATARPSFGGPELGDATYSLS